MSATLAVQRDERYFAPDPARWWPARWLPDTRAEIEQAGGRFVLDTRAYMPFHVGAFSLRSPSLPP
jgi:hypothetical protein